MIDLERFLAMPFADISGDSVRAFYEARIPEGRHVEYKSKLVDGVLQDIAAMANTYGGVVFIGVAEDGRLPVGIQGAEEATYESLVNKCIDRFEPPFVPDAKTVDDPPNPAYFEFVPDEDADMADGSTRHEQLTKWMTEMLLDGGFQDFEQQLDTQL